MATKKQKREALAQRRAEREEERRQSGLAAQRKDREKREAEALKDWQEIHDEKHYKFIDECPHCKIKKRELAAQERSKAVSKIVKATVNA